MPSCYESEFVPEDVGEMAISIESLLPLLMRALYDGQDVEPLDDLPLAQLRIVRVLANGERTPSEIAHILGTSVSSVTQIVQRLEDSGLVLRRQDEIDRRVWHLALTSFGDEQIKERQTRRIGRIHAAMNLVPQSRREEIVRALQDLVEAAKLANYANTPNS